MGIRIPENTMRQNQYSFWAFSRFVTDYPGFADEAFKTENQLRSYVLDDPDRELRWQLEETRKHIFLVCSMAEISHQNSQTGVRIK